MADSKNIGVKEINNIDALREQVGLLQGRVLEREFENGNLKNEVRLLNIELEIYREVSIITQDISNLDAILERFIDTALKALDTDAGTLFLIDKVSNELIFAVVRGGAQDRLKGRRMSVKEGIAGWVARTGLPYIASDVMNEPLWQKEFELMSQYATRDMMAVPLKAGEKIVGVVEVINKKKDMPYQKRDIDILTTLAGHASIILDKARLFLEIEKRIDEFRTLNEVGNLLISTLDQHVVRKRAMEAITKLMNAEVGSLLMVDEEKKELYFEVALGDKSDKVKEIRLKMGEGIAGWVAEHGEPLLIHDVANDPRFYKKADDKTKFVTRNMLCVPVKIKGKVIGVLQAINSKTDCFTDDDMSLFAMFSNQVAIALDNARLYEEIKETFIATAEALSEAIEKRDPYTGGHTKRVLTYSLAIAEYLNMSNEERETLKFSAVLHDIGKIGVDDNILRKQAPLTKEEADVMKKHPLYGYDILGHVKQLKDLMPGMFAHHERPDGKGYPMGLKETDIPMTARIISVADTYDAMTTDRPYRKGLSPQTALDEIKKYSGTQFDRDVAEAFAKAFENGDIHTAS